MYKKGKTQRGITLIALVITIIVMLILVGVTISMAVNGGLFDYAGRAVSETNNAIKAEGQIADGGIEVDGVWYGSINEYLNKDKERISKTESYVGCYADVDGNGTVDGVIYADLAFGINDGEYYEFSYSYEAVVAEELKDYYVSGSHTGDFGTRDVITAIGTGDDRFYVMALSDVGNYTWYANIDDYDVGRYETATSTAFGTGSDNTATMIGIWRADENESKSNNDLWGQLTENNKWFVPSRDEWLAFADAFDVSYDSELETYYDNYRLSDDYWSSSYFDSYGAWFVDFFGEGIYYDDILTGYDRCVRLSSTF